MAAPEPPFMMAKPPAARGSPSSSATAHGASSRRSVLEPNTATTGRSVGERKRVGKLRGGIMRVSDRERLAARARPLGVRVDELESRVHERLGVIERRAGEEELALDVHEDAQAVELEHLVALARAVLELEHVGEPGTPAAAHAHAQARLRAAVLLEQ